MSTVKVAGEVTGVYGWGFVVTEQRKSKTGETYTQRFAVPTDSAPAEHSWVEVEGFLSVAISKPREADGRQFVNLSVRRATVKVTGSAEQGRQRDETTSEPGYTGERVYGRQPGAQGFDDGSVPF